MTLTSKELEIIRLMADGYSNKMIAHAQVGYQESSIETVKARIYTKMKVRNGCECVAVAIRNKLIS